MIHINKETHMVRVEMEKGKFQFTVLMLREREKCNKTMVTIDVQNQGNQDTVFLAQFRPTPLSLKNSEEASLLWRRGDLPKHLNKRDINS